MNAVQQIDASKYIVVTDSQFRFPVLKEDVAKAGRTSSELKAMDGDAYSAWCNEVPMDDSHGAVGTQGCIDFCAELLEAGATHWDIG